MYKNTFSKAYHRLFGFYELLVPFGQGEKLLMLLAKRGLKFWQALPCADGHRFRVSLFTCSSVLAAAAESGIDCRILRGTGLPFIAMRYRRRFGIYIGVAVGLALIFISQLFIWRITVRGLEHLSEEKLLRTLEESGVYVGCFIPDIRIYTCEAEVMRLESGISSFAINLKGTTAEIVLIERVSPPNLAVEDGFADIVAAEDGIVVRVEAARGAPAVQVGDTAVEGQVLISGTVTSLAGNIYTVRARGSIIAAVTERFVTEVPLKLTQKKYTGRTQKLHSLTFLGRELDFLSDGECSFELFDIELTEREVSLLGLDTCLRDTDALCREYIYEDFSIDTAESGRRCLQSFKLFLSTRSEEILDYGYELSQTESGGQRIEAFVTLLRDIGREVPFELPQ